MLEVKNGCDLLSLKAYESLEPKQLTAYNKSANDFVEEFNNANPEGKAVRVKITGINFNYEKGRVNITVEKHKDLSSTVYSLPFSVVDIIAAQVGAVNAIGLQMLHFRTNDLFLNITVKAVKAGEEYQANNETRKYKVPAIVRFGNTYEEISQGKSAEQVMGRVYEGAFKSLILGQTTGAKATKVATTEEVAVEEEEAEI